MLDSALTRSGRFDVKIKIDIPNEEEREGIIKLHLKKVYFYNLEIIKSITRIDLKNSKK